MITLTSQEILEVTLSSLNGLTNISIGGYLLFYGYITLSETKRKQSTLWFASISIMAGIWALVVSSLYLPGAMIHDPILSYIAAGSIPLLFLGFVRHLIYGNQLVWDWKWKGLYILGLVVLAYTSIPNIGMVEYQTGEAVIRLNELPHYIYSTYLLVFFGLGIILLIREMLRNSRRKQEFQSVLLATGIAIVWGVLFNLILPLITNQDVFFRIGPLGLLWMNIIMARLISRYRLFSVSATSLKFLVLFLIVLIAFYLEITKYRYGIETELNSERILMLGSVLGITFLIFRQMLESLRYTDSLEKVQDDLEASIEEKNVFLQIASHQLRTPVSALSGYIEKIRDELPTYHAGERVRDIFDKLLIQVDSLSDIVSDVLSVNSLRSGSFEIGEQKPIEINALLEEIIEQKEFLIETLKVKVDFVPYFDPIIVRADTVKLSQAIINIFENGLRYGQGFVEVAIQRRSGGWVDIIVTDNGLGISEEQQKWIFDKFTRSEAAQKKRPDGSGVGLYLAQLIVQKHRGKISVYSQGAGKGSEFTISLPIVE